LSQAAVSSVRDTTNFSALFGRAVLPQVAVGHRTDDVLDLGYPGTQPLVVAGPRLKAQIHAVPAKQGIHIPVSDLFGVGAAQLLQAAPLDDAYRRRVDSLLALIGGYDAQIAVFTGLAATALTGHPGYRAIQAISGIGPVLAAIFVAEIDDVTRFADAGKLCSWAGLTPRHRESDTTIHRGPITKQGSRLVRWAAIEAIQLTRSGTKLSADKARIIQQRGRNIGKVAAARKLLTLVYYGLRDGHIRSLAAARPS
jgi:transposase